jgi:oxygen-independent coproporphyrinogen-3 oxidase
MAGIYIHIPFCKKRCTYCDFYTEVAPQLIPNLIDSIVKELQIRKDYLQNETIHTIYFGGGTPSILNKSQFELIFDAIYKIYNVADDAEITFEANPDDLTTDFLASIHPLPFNRMSIGIQSFDDTDLKRINRRHSGKEAIDAVKNAQNAGFSNISIDLIYGLPNQTLAAWEKQIDTAFTLNVQHISAYGLTYEEGTALWKQREKGLVKTVDDDSMNDMYLLLIEKVKQNGFEAYEISNFALPNHRSQHNTSYWKQQPYIGIGPSAHSYNLTSRQWNVSSITTYNKAIAENGIFFESETLSTNDRYNDFIMVSLRTSDGIDLRLLENEFGVEFKDYCLQNVQKFIKTNKVDYSNGRLCLSSQGVQISNLIIMDLMRV